MTRGDIPCHLFKKTFQSSTSPPDSPLFFPLAPQLPPPPPISSLSCGDPPFPSRFLPFLWRLSLFLPFSPFPVAALHFSSRLLPFYRIRRENPHRPDAGLSLSHFFAASVGRIPTGPARACPDLTLCGVRREHPSAKMPPRAEQPSAASGKSGHNKNRKPSGSRLFLLPSGSGYTARGRARCSGISSPSSSKMRSTRASASMCSRWICLSEYPICSAASTQVKLH